jgi:signal transduction histidine kinase
MDLDWLGACRPTWRQRARSMRNESLVYTAVAATRRIVTDLRPSILDDPVSQRCTGKQVSTEARRHAHRGRYTEPDIVIDRERGLTLFRSSRRRSPMPRHANATEVGIQLSKPTAARLASRRRHRHCRWCDEQPSSHGIRGMRERAQQPARRLGSERGGWHHGRGHDSKPAA